MTEQDDPRSLPHKLEIKLVDELLSGHLTPEQTTAKRNRLLVGLYGPEPIVQRKRGVPKMPVACQYCVNGLINKGTEGCGNCSGNGWIYAASR